MAEPYFPASRTAVFRLELGGRTGWGHLARCAALALELRTRGWRCFLWSDGDLDLAPADLRSAFDRMHFAGERWSENPPRVVVGADWVVVDLYSAGDGQLRVLRRRLGAGTGAGAPRMLVIDDEGRRRLGAASLVVNARLGLERSPYAAGIPALLGEKHALLRPGLKKPDSIDSPFPVTAEPVLVMLGGSDPGGHAAGVLHGLADIGRHRLAPVLIRGSAAAHEPDIRIALDRFSTSVWLRSVSASALAGWARLCRYAISAAGGTLYELAFLRLPFVAVTVAENQRAFAREVNRRWGLPVVEGDVRLRETVPDAFSSLVESCADPLRADWSVRLAVDGLGASRVADRMEQHL